MLRENELRIGNYIKTDDDIICIVSRIETKEYTHWNSGDCFSITALELNTKDDYLNVRNDNWQPIELTEEIFNGIPYSFTIYLDQDFKGFRIISRGVDFDFELDNYPYLHQLQNLYWCLCEQELNVNI